MRYIALLLALAMPALGADLYPRVGYQGILITTVLGATDLTPAPPENPTGPAAISGMAVDETGWILEVYINNLSTGGSYAYGFDTNNNVVAGTKLAMNVTSQGFTTNGTATTLTRTVYGTKRIRKPYPDEATADEAIVGDTVKIKLALSDYVYSGDSNLTATVLEGLYVQGGTNSLAATSMTVTNRSAQGYFPVIANWGRRGFRVIDTENMDLRVVAFHRHAQNGKPVAAVQFIATDSGANSFTNWQTSMLIDTNMGDEFPVLEYAANFATNTLASGLVTCNARVFPWVGDSSSVIYSGDVTGVSAEFCQLTNAVNYARVRAIVNSSSGSDTTGRAADEIYWATNTSPPKFLTIGRALLHCANTNNANYGRGAQFGGAIIYLEDGDHNYLGSTVTLTTAQPVEAVITPASGATKAGARITTYVTDARAMNDQDKIRLKGITLDTSSTTMFSQLASLAFDDCNINSTASPLAQQTSAGGIWTFENCVITNFAQGLRPYTTQKFPPALIRGNQFLGDVSEIQLACAVGNHHTTNAEPGTILREIPNSTYPPINGFIIAFNRFDRMQRTGAMLSIGSLANISVRGGALVQNVFEYSGTSGATEYFQICGNPSYDYTNMVVWHNLFKNTKTLWGYNDDGSAPVWHVGFSEKGNLVDWGPTKSDTFTGASGGDANRIGNWPVMWGVGNQGFAELHTTNIWDTGDVFFREFYGLNGFMDTAAANPENYAAWVSPQGQGTLGAGDYRLLSTSPLFTRSRVDYVLPYDLAGYARGTNDPAGPYAEPITP